MGKKNNPIKITWKYLQEVLKSNSFKIGFTMLVKPETTTFLNKDDAFLNTKILLIIFVFQNLAMCLNMKIRIF